MLLVAGVAIVGAFVGYAQYQNQAQPIPESEELVAVTEYFDIKLGAKRVEVTLAKGSPRNEPRPMTGDDGLVREIMFYYDFFVFVEGDELPDTVTRVCTTENILYSNKDDLFGIRHGESEELVVGKLGNPSSESIDTEGTAKIINYESLNVSFEIELRSITQRCMVQSPVVFAEEYGSSALDATQ